ncbi:MAG: ABC transporter ATP-binding protein, partial [Nocardioides sp.]|nr:ABC transporter ATP-binding protein [Nocardioides sp.]
MPTTPAPAPATGGALLRRALRRNARRLGGASALIAVWQVSEAMVPVMIGVVVDRAVATGSWSALALWGGVLCALFATLAFSYRGGAIVGEGALQREGHRLRTELSGHLLDPRGARADQVPGDLLAVATGDADQAAAVLRQAWFAVAAVVGFAVTAVVLARIDLVLTLVVLVGVPVALLVNHLLAGPLTRRSAVRQEALGRATGIATDLVTGLRPLKGIGAEDVALARYRRESHRAAEASVAAARWEGLLYGATQGLSGVVLVVVALVAGSRALDGALSIGELIAVVGLAQFVAEPLQTLAYFVAQLAQSRASADRLVTVLATPR